MKPLELAAKVGAGYFILFTLFYIGRFVYAWQSFMKYHSTMTGVDFAYTIISGSIVFEKDVAGYQKPLIFTVMTILAVVGISIWFYQFKWGEQSATVS